MARLARPIEKRIPVRELGSLTLIDSEEEEEDEVGTESERRYAPTFNPDAHDEENVVHCPQCGQFMPTVSGKAH